MFNVECEACKAPYQIDERRVPPVGLKMRCPKCGHSFTVVNPRGSSDPAGPRPAPRQLPSDFPAALGSLDEPDLPVVAADLPAAKGERADLPSPKKPPPRPPPVKPTKMASPAPAAKPAAPTMPAAPAAQAQPVFGDIELDLPEVHADLPEARRGVPRVPPPRTQQFDLDLPAVTSDLPATKTTQRKIDGDLPSVAAPLPSARASVPVRVGGFGELDLPRAADSLFPEPPQDRPAPSVTTGLETFGEIDLPREPPVGVPPLSFAPGIMPHASASNDPAGDFGNVEFEEKVGSRQSQSVRPGVVLDANRGGGLTFGEVDLSSAPDGGPEGESISIADSFSQPDQKAISSSSMGMERPAKETSAALDLPGPQAALTAHLKRGAGSAARADLAEPPRKRPVKGRLALAALALAILAGAALELTPFGAFGYLWLADRIHASDYERATSATVAATEKALFADTYDVAKAAVDAAFEAHRRSPRARSLSAYAALVDSAVTTRFGPDPSRASHALQLLAELRPDEPVKYRDVALAAQSAANDEPEKASKGLDAASIAEPADPAQVEVALLQGNIGIGASDGAAALSAFKRAIALSNDARAHFGLARAYDLLGDPTDAIQEIAAVLSASPQHPGALTLRARMNSAPTDEALALQALATVLEGPARAKASPNELSRAYAARAWVSLERGNATEARDAFAQAVRLNPRNVAALSGEGRLLLSEGRYTEALARFDTEVQLDPRSPGAIADDAEAKLALDHPGEAKQQLTDARQRFPRSLPILLLLGRVEQHLDNNDAAEADMRAAVAMAEPSRRDAALPYVALSELLSSRGKLAEAKSVLDEAKQKLAPSPALDRALGELAELQGEPEIAISQYKAAIAKDPRDVEAHFRLAVTLRRLRRFDEARTELDKVVTVREDYPGLALERGLLFEDSGDVQKAIAQFKSALARAPDDPDLQLRIGSAYVAIGRADDATPMLRKVLLERPTSAEAHHYLGRALMLQGPTQLTEALRYLKRAVDLDPNRAEFHVYLAWAANDAVPPQVELASDQIDKALSLDKLNAEAYWQKGILERMQGAVVDAIKDEKRALELRPSRYEAHATLAECYEDRNQEGPAMAEWAKAIAADTDAAGPNGGVRHPFWRYRYGKLLMDRGNASAALSLFTSAATSVEQSEQRPWWLASLEFSTAGALDRAGHKVEAAEHYRRFLEIASVSSPDRADAEAALNRLSGAHPL